MDELLFVSDIMERYHCKEKTARKYMHQMRHQEKPLSVTPQAVRDWDLERTVDPSEAQKSKEKKRAQRVRVSEPDNGKFLISRTRPKVI